MTDDGGSGVAYIPNDSGLVLIQIVHRAPHMSELEDCHYISVRYLNLLYSQWFGT